MQTENNNPDYENDNKPVGYGSSMQTGGLGNKTRPEDKDKQEVEKEMFDKTNKSKSDDANTIK